MSRHTCHALDCKAPCPSAHLMCRRHWRMVPPELQAEVYRTVKLRKSAIDESWGPWTRATGRAMAYVKKLEDPKFDDAEYIAYKDSIADRMERRSTTP